jgi:glycerol uptake facilitator-like aquaporin
VLGLIGAVVGGYIFSKFGAKGVNGFNIYSVFVAMVGAIIVLLMYHAIAGRRTVDQRSTYAKPATNGSGGFFCDLVNDDAVVVMMMVVVMVAPGHHHDSTISMVGMMVVVMVVAPLYNDLSRLKSLGFIDSL